MKTVRTITILVLALGCVGSAKAQWIVSGNDMYTNISGNIGVGTTNPGAKLEVGGSVRFGTPSANQARVLTLQCKWDNVIAFERGGDGTPDWQIGLDNTDGSFLVQRGSKVFGTAGDVAISVESNGDVGIGTTSPTAKLEIGGSGNLLLKASSDDPGDIVFQDSSGTQKGRIWTSPGVGFHQLYLSSRDNIPDLIVNENGSVGIGTERPQAKLDVVGRIRISNSAGQAIMELGEGLDYAEGFDVSDKTEMGPGSVLIIDADHPGKLALSYGPYDSKVAGIIAGAKGNGSGVRLGTEQFDFDVALAGRVYCNVDATEVAVEPGDLLTTSSKPGYAMKAVDHVRAQGAILGKAMEKLEKGKKDQILVLVTLQ